MNAKGKIDYSKILANNWVVTLTATLIGVFVALYLNEWMASRKLSNQKAIATKNISIELNSNKDYLKDALLRHEELIEIMSFLGQYVDDNDDLIAPVKAFNAFKKKYPDLINIEDSTFVEEGIYNYDGEINLDLSFPHFELTTITWKTLKNSGIVSDFDFECLLYLETVDNVTNEVGQKNKELLDYFSGIKDSGAQNENLISHLNLLIHYEESLIEIYESSEERLKNCN